MRLLSVVMLRRTCTRRASPSPVLHLPAEPPLALGPLVAAPVAMPPLAIEPPVAVEPPVSVAVPPIELPPTPTSPGGGSDEGDSTLRSLCEQALQAAVARNTMTIGDSLASFMGSSFGAH